MNVLVVIALAFAFGGGLIGAVLVDARFWWSFIQEVYYHHPGNHLCDRAGCCR